MPSIETALLTLQGAVYTEELARRACTDHEQDGSIAVLDHERVAARRTLLAASRHRAQAQREFEHAQARLPYRPRVEIIPIVRASTGIYAAWTRWDNDQTLQFIGGGIGSIEKPEDAARRVLLAKALLVPERVGVIPGLHAVSIEWNFPFDGDRQRERATSFRGAMTFLVFADLGAHDELPELPGVFAWHPLEVRPDNNTNKAKYPDLARARACALDIVSRLHQIL